MTDPTPNAAAEKPTLYSLEPDRVYDALLFARNLNDNTLAAKEVVLDAAERYAVTDPTRAEPTVRHVCQEDRSGCVIACVAMLTGQTYEEVKRVWIEEMGADPFNLRAVGNGAGVSDEGMKALFRKFKISPAVVYPPALVVLPRKPPEGNHVVVITKQGEILDPAAPAHDPTRAEAIERACEVMHDAYEAAAQREGWETQARSRKPWSDVPDANKATMRAAVGALLGHLAAAPAHGTGEPGPAPHTCCRNCGGPVTWLGHKYKCVPCEREIPTREWVWPAEPAAPAPDIGEAVESAVDEALHGKVDAPAHLVLKLALMEALAHLVTQWRAEREQLEAIRAAFGLHPDADHDSLMRVIEDTRHEARAYPDLQLKLEAERERAGRVRDKLHNIEQEIAGYLNFGAMSSSDRDMFARRFRAALASTTEDSKNETPQ